MRPGGGFRLERGLVLVLALLMIWTALPAHAGGERCMGRNATIVGTNGSDRLVGTNGPDVIDGRKGFDYILGRGGDDLICGGSGDDHLDAGAGADALTGDRGDDTLVAGRGTEFMGGKDGVDTFFPAGGRGGRIVGGRGGDWVAFSDRTCPGGIRVDLADHRIAYPGCAAGWERGRWVVHSVDRVDGSQGDDVFIGSRKANQLLGQGGADKLLGKAGPDLLHGGTGRDRGRGGTGADRCVSLEVRDSC